MRTPAVLLIPCIDKEGFIKFLPEMDKKTHFCVVDFSFRFYYRNTNSLKEP